LLDSRTKGHPLRQFLELARGQAMKFPLDQAVERLVDFLQASDGCYFSPKDTEPHKVIQLVELANNVESFQIDFDAARKRWTDAYHSKTSFDATAEERLTHQRNIRFELEQLLLCHSRLAAQKFKPIAPHVFSGLRSPTRDSENFFFIQDTLLGVLNGAEHCTRGSKA